MKRLSTLTGHRVCHGSLFSSLRHDNPEPAVQMELNVAVEEPWSRIVRLSGSTIELSLPLDTPWRTYLETNGDIVVTTVSNAHDVAPNRILIVVNIASGASHDAERMLVIHRQYPVIPGNAAIALTPCKWNG